MTNDFTCLGLIAVVFVVAILENPCFPDAADPIKFDDAESKKLFAAHGWPIIDVTRRSIEETAAAIMDLYKEHRQKQIAET